ncbi:MAG TPA: aspartyl protease family protein [Steroidobacteraceae bacterium]|jgi:predicted aspartyl protease
MSRPVGVFGLGWIVACFLVVGASSARADNPETPAPAVTAAPPTIDQLTEVVIEAPEPVYVAPTLRDKIGRIWAPVSINGKGPFRLVLDTGASRSAVVNHVAQRLALKTDTPLTMIVHGVTGSATVPGVKVNRMEVGELLMMDPSNIPVVPDAFGGAEGVLGHEGLADKRISADFIHDKLVISRSHGERAKDGFVTIPLKLTNGGLLYADVYVGSVRCKAIIDTGGQQSVANMALRDALMRHPPMDARRDEIIGVTLDIQQGTTVRIPPIRFTQGLNIHNAHLTFGNLFLFEHWNLEDQPILLVGMDVLGLFDTLIIDYKMRELQVRTRHDGDDGIRIRTDTNNMSFLGR